MVSQIKQYTEACEDGLQRKNRIRKRICICIYIGVKSKVGKKLRNW